MINLLKIFTLLALLLFMLNLHGQDCSIRVMDERGMALKAQIFMKPPVSYLVATDALGKIKIKLGCNPGSWVEVKAYGTELYYKAEFSCAIIGRELDVRLKSKKVVSDLSHKFREQVKTNENKGLIAMLGNSLVADLSSIADSKVACKDLRLEGLLLSFLSETAFENAADLTAYRTMLQRVIPSGELPADARMWKDVAVVPDDTINQEYVRNLIPLLEYQAARNAASLWGAPPPTYDGEAKRFVSSHAFKLALLSFQQQNGLPQTGVPDFSTLAAKSNIKYSDYIPGNFLFSPEQFLAAESGTLIPLGGKWSFATPDSEASKELEGVLTMMLKNKKLIIQLESFVAQEASVDNHQISQARAKAVVDYLVSHGISPSRVSGKGFGESPPASAVAWDENQGMQIRIIKN